MMFEVEYDQQEGKMCLSECNSTPCEYDVSSIDDCIEIIRDYMQNSVDDGEGSQYHYPAENDIHYIKGDATKPVQTFNDSNQIIAHICNDKGGWGAGFVLALSKLSSLPELSYRKAFKYNEKFGLGFVDFVTIKEGEEKKLLVANMVAQHGYKSADNPVPLSYPHLEECLEKVGKYAALINASVHMPQIGAGLAGGNWDKISKIIKDKICSLGVPTYVYLWE